MDTFQSTVAREAVAAGADIVNDVSGGLLDAKMFATVQPRPMQLYSNLLLLVESFSTWLSVSSVIDPAV